MLGRALAGLCVLLLLGSCGGGGGGGGSSPPPGSNFRVTFDRSSIAFDYFEGMAAQPQTITGTGTGDPGGTVFVSALIDGTAIDPSGISLTFVGDQAQVAVTPRTDLVAGTYSGRLILQACADAQCSRHFSGSPFIVTTSSVVRSRLRVLTPDLNLTAAGGQSTRTRVNVQPAEGSSFTTQVVGGEPWISVQDADATGFTVVSAPLPGGNYFGSVRVTSGPFQQALNVALAVSAAPGEHDLQVGATSLALAAGATGSARQDIAVTPPTWSNAVTAEIVYATGAGWLSAVSNGNGTWAVRASALALAQGTYTATLTLRAAFPSQPVSVGVTFIVGNGLVVPAETLLPVSSETTSAMLAIDTPMRVAGDLPFTWTASTSTPWLRVDTAAGDAGATLRWHVDIAALGALGNFADHAGTVDIATNLPTVPGGTLTVRLSKRLAEVHAVAPYVVTRGRPARVLVRGRGFDGALDVAARLSVAGVTPASVTRINDQQLVVQLPSIALPSTPVRATNALGLDTGVFALKTAPAIGAAYAALDVGGFAKSLTYDAERRALYFVRQVLPANTNSLVRMTFDGAAWTATPMLGADLYDVALGPDGSALLAAMAAGELRWLDPAGSAELRPRVAFGRTLSDDREFFAPQGLSVTADSRLWLPLDSIGGGPFKTLAHVDLRAGTVGTTPGLGNEFTLYRGPLFSMPRDGSRLIGRQNSGLSGVDTIYDAVKYDTATGTFSRTVKVRSPFDVRFTHDGRLAVVNLDRVVDGNEDLHGLVRLPAAHQADWVVVAAQITSDGARVYLLAYPNRGQFESSTSGIKPRVYALDSSAPSADPAGLPVLGYFEIDDYASPCIANNFVCWYGLGSALSPDDGTLFFAGGLRTLVVPIAPALTPVTAGVRPAARWTLPAR